MSAIDEKKVIVEEIRSSIDNSTLVVASDYRGISANGANDFRARLRKSGATAKVYKNTLVRIALKELEVAYPENMLTGPTLLIHTENDVVSVSKTIVDFIKDNDITLVKGGLLQKSYIDEKGIQELAKLPSRDELIAKTVYMIKSPLSRLVSSVSSPLSGLVAVLNQIETKKQED
jgi:large subunit ribosomal protein L10